MPDYVLGWVDIAIEQYLALRNTQQQLIDTRIQQLLDDPAGPRSSHDPETDLWTTSDSAGAGLIVYVFRAGRPRLLSCGSSTELEVTSPARDARQIAAG